jgi:DNA-binding winged helix-turn-helix (wHTH) protein
LRTLAHFWVVRGLRTFVRSDRRDPGDRLGVRRFRAVARRPGAGPLAAMGTAMHSTFESSPTSFPSAAPALVPDQQAVGSVTGYRAGDYTIDLACFELRHRGSRRPLQPRAFDLLVYLVARRHRVVTIEELRAEVWGGVQVCADSLTYSVSAARRALGDDGKTQAAIVNVRGRGYRFVAPVEELRTAGGFSLDR